MEYEVYPSLVPEWMDDRTVLERVKRRPDTTDIGPLVRQHVLLEMSYQSQLTLIALGGGHSVSSHIPAWHVHSKW